MDFGAKPSGTKPSDTQSDILNAELEKLKNSRLRMKEENEAYLLKHPELRTMLDQFMTAALTSKPADVIKFASTYFTQLRNPNAVEGPMPLVLTGCNYIGKSIIYVFLKHIIYRIYICIIC